MRKKELKASGINGSNDLSLNHILSSLHTTEDKLIATVELYNLNGKFLSRGFGKGQWAVVGAYFQVFEHMMLEHQFTTPYFPY